MMGVIETGTYRGPTFLLASVEYIKLEQHFAFERKRREVILYFKGDFVL